MATWLQFDFSDSWVRALAVLVDMAVKGIVILALATMVAAALRRSSAATRHLVWALALIGLLLLPMLALVMPKWQLPILPPVASSSASTSAVQGDPRADGKRANAPPMVQSGGSIAPAAATTPMSAGTEPNHAPELASLLSRASNLAQLIFWLWLAGVMASLAPLVAGMVLVGRLRRHARPMDLPAWPELAGLSVEVRQTLDGAMPMATGLVRPMILLPGEFVGWPEEKRRAVLLHELAHVQRRDCLTHALARVAVALHWFNPLAWVTLRRLRIERESACDDLVLSAGEQASVYADQLLEIARTTHAGALESVVAITMAKKSQLEGRLLAVLDATRNRRTLRWGVIAFGIIILLAVTVPLGMLKLSEAKLQPDPVKTPRTFDYTFTYEQRRFGLSASQAVRDNYVQQITNEKEKNDYINKITHDRVIRQRQRARTDGTGVRYEVIEDLGSPSDNKDAQAAQREKQSRTRIFIYDGKDMADINRFRNDAIIMREKIGYPNLSFLMQLQTQKGPYEHIEFNDYRLIKGYRIPFQIFRRDGQMEEKITIEKVDVDVSFEDGLFDIFKTIPPGMHVADARNPSGLTEYTIPAESKRDDSKTSHGQHTLTK